MFTTYKLGSLWFWSGVGQYAHHKSNGGFVLNYQAKANAKKHFQALGLSA